MQKKKIILSIVLAAAIIALGIISAIYITGGFNLNRSVPPFDT